MAHAFGMTLTGIKKHVRVLEDAGLVKTKKVGRERRCTLGPQDLEREAAWLDDYRRMLERRRDCLAEFLERTNGVANA